MPEDLPMIPYGHQSISDDDVDAVVEVLRSDWLTQGPTIERFERAVAEYCGAKHAVAVANGTGALHLSCLAAGLGEGGLLWTSPNTFAASANCARYVGADVDFVDIDPRTYNVSVAALAAKLEAAEAAGRLPDVVVPVDMTGQPCDLAAIRELADAYGFVVIEDASHAIGATYRGTRVGSGGYSDMTVFSFHPVKIVTTGEGGMVLTDDDRLAERLKLLRTHGITRDEALMEGPSEGPWYYEQIALGFNYRMTDLQAALGASQMTRIEEFLERRRAIAWRYNEAFADLPLQLPWQHPDTVSAWHLYVIVLDSTAAPDRRTVFERLRAAGIGVNVHYIPVHLQPYYRRLGFAPGDFPEAERYYAGAISLPMFAALTDTEQDRVIAAVRDAVLGVSG